MSTVPEAIVARKFGMRVIGISCITNAAAGISKTNLTHEEVTETADRVRPQSLQICRCWGATCINSTKNYFNFKKHESYNVCFIVFVVIIFACLVVKIHSPKPSTS